MEKNNWLWLVVGAMLACCALWVAVASVDTGNAPDGWVWPTAPCYCGATRETAADIYRAIGDADTAGVLALVHRGQAFAIGDTDRLRVVYRDDGFAAVRVLSGSSIGVTCWLPSRLLHRVVHKE